MRSKTGKAKEELECWILKRRFRQFSLHILLRRYFVASKPQTSKLRVRKCTTRFRENGVVKR